MSKQPVEPASTDDKPSVIRQVGRGLKWSVGLPVMLPMRAVGFMMRSFGKSLDARRGELGYLNELRKGATAVPDSDDAIDMSYNQVVLRLHTRGDSVGDAALRFLKKKQLYLLLWFGLAVLAVLTSFRSHMLVGLAMLVGSTGFLLAQVFICSFRLWQLRVHRVSIAEGGGVSDFLRESQWLVECFRWGQPANLGERE